MKKIEAPFSAEQVRLLNAYQSNGVFSPYCCVRPHSGMGRLLVATTEGWSCPSCDFTQNWAHEFMADPRWERRTQ